LLISIFGVFTSDSWFMVWVWLEINVLGVLPLLVGSGYSVHDSSSSVFYFLVQACGSFLVLIPGVLFLLGLSYSFLVDFLLSAGLAIKLGLFPVHFWVAIVSRSLSWWKIIIVLVVQKLAPVWLVCSVRCFYFLGWLGILSVVFGSLALVNCTRVKELFSFSSVSNTGWVLIAVLFSSSAGLIYFSCYLLVSFFSTLLFGVFGLSGSFSSLSFSG